MKNIEANIAEEKNVHGGIFIFLIFGEKKFFG